MTPPVELVGLLRAGGVCALSGAGLSTGSGIPDYRGPTGLARAATPMTYQAFVGSAQARQRYWARSHLGWHTISAAQPNAGHRAVAQLQTAGLLTGLITQNVDGLHRAAGSPQVNELHGVLSRVVCLSCRQVTARSVLHERLAEANPQWGRVAAPLLPDGDVDLDDVQGFVVVDCEACGGLLKPDVVYFGESVPRDRVDEAFASVGRSRALLVLGSSLKVMSGYRFVLFAKRQGIPVAIVNQGQTRGDVVADLRLEAELSTLLSAVVDLALTSSAA